MTPNDTLAHQSLLAHHHQSSFPLQQTGAKICSQTLHK